MFVLASEGNLVGFKAVCDALVFEVSGKSVKYNIKVEISRSPYDEVGGGGGGVAGNSLLPHAGYYRQTDRHVYLESYQEIVYRTQFPNKLRLQTTSY